MRRNIALVGMMGAGKSTIGRLLSDELTVPCIEMDQWIETKYGKTIPDIFAEWGESTFRQLEWNALRELTSASYGTPCILSTGGGTVTTPTCRTMLRTEWYTIWLDASVDTLVARLGAAVQQRPMLEAGESLRTRIEDLLTARNSLYEVSSHLHLRVDGQTELETARIIRQHITNLT